MTECRHELVQDLNHVSDVHPSLLNRRGVQPVKRIHQLSGPVLVQLQHHLHPARTTPRQHHCRGDRHLDRSLKSIRAALKLPKQHPALAGIDPPTGAARGSSGRHHGCLPGHGSIRRQAAVIVPSQYSAWLSCCSKHNTSEPALHLLCQPRRRLLPARKQVQRRTAIPAGQSQQSYLVTQRRCGEAGAG